MKNNTSFRLVFSLIIRKFAHGGGALALLFFFNNAMGQTNVTTTGGSVNTIPKFSSTDNIENSQLFDNGTNIGIGTVAPNSKLHVLDGNINVTSTGTVPGNTRGYYIQGFHVLKLPGTVQPDLGIALGDSAGSSLTTGASNVFVGKRSGTMTTVGASNVYIGREAGELSVAGGSNVMIGFFAGESTTVPGAANINTFNTFLGFQAGRNGSLIGGQTGLSNTYLGANAGMNSNSGSNNIAVGMNAGNPASISAMGTGNISIGASSGTNNTGTTSVNNILLGNAANVTATGFTNAVAIGANTLVAGSNTMLLGDNNMKVGIGMNGQVPAEKLSVAGTIQSTTGGFKFPDNTIQTTAGVQQNSSATFSSLLVSSLAGVGDRSISVDANGNLKISPNQFLGLPWELDGNDLSTTPTAFIGTTDPSDLVFKTEGIEYMRITSSGHQPTPDHAGNVGIGTSDPQKKLHVVTSHTTCATCPPLTHEGIRIEEQTYYSDLNSTTISAWDLQPYSSPSAAGFAIKRPNEDPKIFIRSNGFVGIGTISPSAKLDVNGNGHFSSDVEIDGNTAIEGNAVVGTNAIPQNLTVNGNSTVTNNHLVAGNIGIGTLNPNAQLQIVPTQLTSSILEATNPSSPIPYFAVYNSTGKVSIGVELSKLTDNNNTGPPYKLYVAGGIMTEHLRVAYKGNITEWGDWVFDKNNKRMTFEEQAKYYEENKHLKGIPPAFEIKNKGIDVSDMFANVVINLEETRLDNIELHKQNEEQKNAIHSMKVEMEKMQKQMEELKRK